MIDFELQPQLVELRDRVAGFVAEVAIPAEPRDVSTHGTDEALRAEQQDEAKRSGVFGSQPSEELGGLGLDHRGRRLRARTAAPAVAS
jgi:acyl-CoA dehydrogenase